MAMYSPGAFGLFIGPKDLTKTLSRVPPQRESKNAYDDTMWHTTNACSYATPARWGGMTMNAAFGPSGWYMPNQIRDT